MNKKKTLFVIGANGYIGSALFASAKKMASVIGTSSSGGGGLLPLTLDKPNEFDFNMINAGDIFFLQRLFLPQTCVPMSTNELG